MNPATKAGGKPFSITDRAGSKLISDHTPELLILDPAIQGDRPISCECGCPNIGEHNKSVSILGRMLNRAF